MVLELLISHFFYTLCVLIAAVFFAGMVDWTEDL